MLGRHHLTLTVLTAAIIIVPYLDTFYGILGLLGAAIGSLIPDSDSPDAMIFHDKARMKGETGDLVNKYFAPLFSVFGHTTKYLIYKPSVIFYKILGLEVEEKHRGLMHSVLGVLTATLLTVVYSSIVLWFLGLLDFFALATFAAFYIFGSLMHLLEDSMTVSGIKWFYPFSDLKLKGKIRTTTDSKDSIAQDIFASILLALLATAYSLNIGLSSLTTSAILTSLIGAFWIVFGLVSGLSLER